MGTSAVHVVTPPPRNVEPRGRKVYLRLHLIGPARDDVSLRVIGAPLGGRCASLVLRAHPRGRLLQGLGAARANLLVPVQLKTRAQPC